MTMCVWEGNWEALFQDFSATAFVKIQPASFLTKEQNNNEDHEM